MHYQVNFLSSISIYHEYRIFTSKLIIITGSWLYKIVFPSENDFDKSATACHSSRVLSVRSTCEAKAQERMRAKLHSGANVRF